MIFPAIDLMDGRCVRLLKGDFNQRTNYETAPVDMARQFASQGAEWLHVVDLDGAKRQKSEQADLIIEIANESGLKVQTGGGLRDLASIQRLLDNGVTRVVIGSLAVSNPQMIKFWLSELGQDKIVLALDINIDEAGIPFPTRHGWTEKAENSLWDVLDDYSGSGLATILVTDISRDGVLAGSNTQLYRDIQEKYPDINLITSGGVGTLKDVRALKKLDPHGIIIGKALYEEKFTLAEAIAC